MKRAWIYILAAVLVFTVVISSLLIFVRTSPSGVISGGDPTSRYSYAFRNTKEGLQITIDGPFPKGSAWTAASRSVSVATVTEKRQNARRAEFLVRPLSWGNTGITFCLTQGESSIYELNVAVSVDTERQITVLENGHRENLTVSGQGGQYTYCIRSAPDGSLELVADNEALCRWRLRVVGDCVAAAPAAEGMRNEEEESDAVQYRIVWIKAGTDTLQLTSEALGETIRITVDAAADGTLSVADHRITKDAVELPAEYAEQAEAYRRLLGEPALPEQAELIIANAILWSSRAERGKYLDAGLLEFELNGRTWTLYGSDEASAEDFYADLAAEAGAAETVEADGCAAEIYSHPEGAFAFWQSASGRSWFLQSEGAGTMAVMAVAEKLLKAVA